MMRRPSGLVCLGLAGFLATSLSQATPCGFNPVKHHTTRAIVTLSDGQTAQTEVHVHNHVEDNTTTSAFGIVDADGRTLAGVYRGNKSTDEYSVDFRERPTKPKLLILGYNLTSFKNGRPTNLEVTVRDQVYEVTIDAAGPTREQREQLAKIKRAVRDLPANFLTAVRMAYSISSSHAAELPVLDMLVYVVDDLPDRTIAAEVEPSDLQVKQFQERFADLPIEDKDRHSEEKGQDSQRPN